MALYLIAIFIFSRNRAIHGVHMHGLLTFQNFFVFDATFTTIAFAHVPYSLQNAVNINARAQCTEIGIPKCDGHTYIEMRSRIS